MTCLLEAVNVNKMYPIGKNNEQHVLKDVAIRIDAGEFISVMGPSGSGKSTLLYNISGMDKMTSGRVVLDGQEITSLSETALSQLRLTKMGFIFQQNNLLKNLTIYDNIVLSAYMAKREDRSHIDERAESLMKLTDITDVADKDITQASGGQLQRAALCRALINNPAIIFGDEPTGALNSKAAGEVMDLLASINREGATIMLVTHDAKVAAKTERVIYMLDGCIMDELHLGKYKEAAQLKKREEKLASWLNTMGF